MLTKDSGLSLFVNLFMLGQFHGRKCNLSLFYKRYDSSQVYLSITKDEY